MVIIVEDTHTHIWSKANVTQQGNGISDGAFLGVDEPEALPPGFSRHGLQRPEWRSDTWGEASLGGTLILSLQGQRVNSNQGGPWGHPLPVPLRVAFSGQTSLLTEDWVRHRTNCKQLFLKTCLLRRVCRSCVSPSTQAPLSGSCGRLTAGSAAQQPWPRVGSLPPRPPTIYQMTYVEMSNIVTCGNKLEDKNVLSFYLENCTIIR